MIGSNRRCDNVAGSELGGLFDLARLCTAVVRLRQHRELCEQLGVRWLRHLCIANRVHHLVDDIERLQDGVHQVRRDAALPLAKHVEHVLRQMTGFHQRRYREEARAALYRMKAAEDRIQQVRVIGALFQIHQLFAEQFDDLGRLNKKILENFVICIETHGLEPQTGKQVVNVILTAHDITFVNAGHHRPVRLYVLALLGRRR